MKLLDIQVKFEHLGGGGRLRGGSGKFGRSGRGFGFDETELGAIAEDETGDQTIEPRIPPPMTMRLPSVEGDDELFSESSEDELEDDHQPHEDGGADGRPKFLPWDQVHLADPQDAALGLSSGSLSSEAATGDDVLSDANLLDIAFLPQLKLKLDLGNGFLNWVWRKFGKSVLCCNKVKVLSYAAAA